MSSCIELNATVKSNSELWSSDRLNYGDNTEINSLNACPLLIESRMYLFGGKDEPRQITEVYPWGSSIARRILNLPFDFESGRCVYHGGVVYLCFGDGKESLCRARYLSKF